VQTLRNTIIVATFVGGFAFTQATNNLGGATQSSLVGGEVVPFVPGEGSLRSVLQAALLFFAFMNFALVVRTASHLGYLMGSATGQLGHADHPNMQRLESLRLPPAPPTPALPPPQPPAAAAPHVEVHIAEGSGQHAGAVTGGPGMLGTQHHEAPPPLLLAHSR